MAKNDDDVTDIDVYLRTAPPKYLVCREIGHAWDPQHEGWLRPTNGHPWRVLLKCLRCGGDGEIVEMPGQGFVRRSTLDPDYYIKGARLPRNDVRAFSLARAKEATYDTPKRPRQRRRRS